MLLYDVERLAIKEQREAMPRLDLSLGISHIDAYRNSQMRCLFYPGAQHLTVTNHQTERDCFLLGF